MILSISQYPCSNGNAAMQKCRVVVFGFRLNTAPQQNTASQQFRSLTMTHLTETLTSGPHRLMDYIRHFVQADLAATQAGLARRAAYRRAYCELSALSQRDLSDIGVQRSDIGRLASEEALRSVPVNR
jgi:uncharacterized protein YjiS (DUF1127 family)